MAREWTWWPFPVCPSYSLALAQTQPLSHMGGNHKKDCCICLESYTGLFVSEVWFELHRKMMMGNSSSSQRTQPSFMSGFLKDNNSALGNMHTPLRLQGIDLWWSAVQWLASWLDWHMCFAIVPWIFLACCELCHVLDLYLFPFAVFTACPIWWTKPQLRSNTRSVKNNVLELSLQPTFYANGVNKHF